jgi:hypothetical protein
MSGPTIRINDGAFPEISASAGSDMGGSIEISDLNDFDLGLLGNQRKLAAPMAPGGGIGGGGLTIGGGGGGDLKAVDDIERAEDAKANGGDIGKCNTMIEKANKEGWTLSRLWVMGHLGGVPNV